MNKRERPKAVGPSPGKRRRAPDWLLFLSKFLRHGKAIASFVPSSGYLAQAVVRGIDYEKCRTVVELGAGTGPITAKLLAQVKAPCKALIIERDHDFCTRLRERFPAERFPQAEIVEADALDLDRILLERNIEVVDHFLCGLPLPSFPAPARDTVLEIVHRRLDASGTFRQLTHMPWIYYPLYRRYFAKVDFRLVIRNLPPAGFYICTEPRPAQAKATPPAR